MSEFTSQGVKTKSLSEWYDAVVAFKRSVWGDNYVIDPTTKQGADIMQLAELLYNAEMNNVSAFAQLNINTATGVCLDYLGQIKGVYRNVGFPQEIRVNITSNIIGYNITPSLVFQTVDGLHTYTVATSVEITSLNQEVVLVSTEAGDPDVNDGDTLRTVTTFPMIVNVQIVNGGVTAGTETEDDASYRSRIQDSEIGYIGTLELMYAELLTVKGISKANFYYNDDSIVDAKGITPYSTEFLAVPDDGVDDTTFNNLVAQKICDIKEPGAPTYGNTTVQVLDYMGQDKTIKFTRPTKVNIQFKAKVGITESGKFSLDNLQLEKQQMVDYIKSMKIGNDVEWSRMLGFIASDPNFAIIDWSMRRTDGAWGTSNIVIDFREFAWIELSDIIIGTDDI